jgi:hypothetical protein
MPAPTFPAVDSETFDTDLRTSLAQGLVPTSDQLDIIATKRRDIFQSLLAAMNVPPSPPIPTSPAMAVIVQPPSLGAAAPALPPFNF